MMLLKIVMLSIDTVIPHYLIQSAGEIFDAILPSDDSLIDIFLDRLGQDFPWTRLSFLIWCVDRNHHELETVSLAMLEQVQEGGSGRGCQLCFLLQLAAVLLPPEDPISWAILLWSGSQSVALIFPRLGQAAMETLLGDGYTISRFVIEYSIRLHLKWVRCGNSHCLHPLYQTWSVVALSHIPHCHLTQIPREIEVNQPRIYPR